MISKSSKRRRIAADASSQGTTTCPLYDLLPGGILEEVATFLAAPSRVLFAVAITPRSSPYDIIMSRRRSNVSRSSIAGNAWHTLDFGDIEKELATKLSDDDINDILVHIDAANKLKRLRLTNCINITGAGLISLRGSTSIEQIDLNLVGANQRARIQPKPPLSCGLVLPILDSIISHERCSLKHLQFPHAWRKKRPTDSQFIEFLERYNEMMGNRDAFFCEKCNHDLNMSNCIRMGLYYEEEDDNDYFGIQDGTCCVCTKSYCYGCRYNYVPNARLCRTCERECCSKCATMIECGACDDMFCVGCLHHNCSSPHCSVNFCDSCRTDNACPQCDKSWCDTCEQDVTEPSCKGCDGIACFERCCMECSEKEGVNGVHWCDVCETKRCDKCRVKECQRGDNNCKACVKMIAPLLLGQNRQLRDKNEEMSNEIKSLKDRNKLLGDENKKLRGKLNVIRHMAS
jgi:hypothetical protein